jgi:hypothetical protein
MEQDQDVSSSGSMHKHSFEIQYQNSGNFQKYALRLQRTCATCSLNSYCRCYHLAARRHTRLLTMSVIDRKLLQRNTCSALLLENCHQTSSPATCCRSYVDLQYLQRYDKSFVSVDSAAAFVAICSTRTKNILR